MALRLLRLLGLLPLLALLAGCTPKIGNDVHPVDRLLPARRPALRHQPAGGLLHRLQLRAGPVPGPQLDLRGLRPAARPHLRLRRRRALAPLPAELLPGHLQQHQRLPRPVRVRRPERARKPDRPQRPGRRPGRRRRRRRLQGVHGRHLRRRHPRRQRDRRRLRRQRVRPCANGKRCPGSNDCFSGGCRGNICVGDKCADALKDATETDVDCGGARVRALLRRPGVPAGRTARSLLCTATQHLRAGRLRQRRPGPQAAETDVDCGGGGCQKCALTQRCALDRDCTTATATAPAAPCPRPSGLLGPHPGRRPGRLVRVHPHVPGRRARRRRPHRRRPQRRRADRRRADHAGPTDAGPTTRPRLMLA